MTQVYNKHFSIPPNSENPERTKTTNGQTYVLVFSKSFMHLYIFSSFFGLI